VVVNCNDFDGSSNFSCSAECPDYAVFIGLVAISAMNLRSVSGLDADSRTHLRNLPTSAVATILAVFRELPNDPVAPVIDSIKLSLPAVR
jgi:hypothetical protein